MTDKVKTIKIENDIVFDFLTKYIKMTALKFKYSYSVNPDDSVEILNVKKTDMENIISKISIGIHSAFNNYIENELNLNPKEVNRVLPLIIFEETNGNLRVIIR